MNARETERGTREKENPGTIVIRSNLHKALGIEPEVVIQARKAGMKVIERTDYYFIQDRKGHGR